jgi:four helix bundle protein
MVIDNPAERAVHQNGGGTLVELMASTNTHRDLAAWREAISLVRVVYQDTAGFPKDEVFGLRLQLRRCAVSVPSNIAEGAGRNNTREFVQFLGFACGSLAELDTQVEIAIQLGYLDSSCEATRQLQRVGSIVRRLRKSLKERIN